MQNYACALHLTLVLFLPGSADPGTRERAKPECHVHFLSLQHSAQQRLDPDGVSNPDAHVLLCYIAQADLASRKS